MNEILKDLLMILSGIIGGTLVIYIKNKFFTKAKAAVVDIIPETDKAKIKELYEKNLIPKKVYEQVFPSTTESFDSSKAVSGLVNIKNPVLWAKDIASIFNLRKLIIVGVILGAIYGYGWYKGHTGIQPILDWHGKEEWVSLNEHYLHILKDGTMLVVDSDKKTILKKITVKDLENLKNNLRPYGFRLKPFVTAGGSLGNKAGFEAGAGIDFFKWFKWNANVFATNLGAYLGAGYQITENFDIMLGYGKGWKQGDNRVGLFGKWKF